MTTASKRLPEFDVLRTVAILLLLVHHSGFYSLDLGLNLQVLSPFFEAFLLGCFFFISGYFTETSLQKSGGDLRRFFLPRFVKVYPPYLIALALFLSVLGITLRERFDLFVYAAGLQFVFAGMVKPILTLWYVGAILLFYVLFGLLWKFAPKTTFLVFIASVLFVLALLAHKVGGLFDARFFKYYFVFLTGMLTARHAEPGGVLSSRYLLLKVLAALIGIRVFSLVSSGEPVSLPYITASYVFIVSTTILLFAVIAKLSIVSPWRWVTGVSYASYFIYLFHRPFWQILENIFPVHEQQYRILFRLLPASVVVVLVCYFLQRLYDSLLASFGRQSLKPK
ncbi:MAG: acyltransferase [Anaerolineales bacterium]|nr:acyltransferase [Anaerolineales bacterium]